MRKLHPPQLHPPIATPKNARRFDFLRRNNLRSADFWPLRAHCSARTAAFASLPSKRSAHTHAAALILLAIIALVSASPAAAQTFTFSVGGEGDGDVTVVERAVQLISLLTVISLAPSMLVMVTSFTRIVVVLSLLRTAIGLQQSPPNAVLISLALFLTGFIMAPTLEATYDVAIAPMIAGDMDPQQAFSAGTGPLREFMMPQTREADIALFIGAAELDRPETPDDVPMRALVPAFMLSELRRAFEIGFVVFVPFLVIDLVVASVLMSMGMMMLPPVIISLPFKIIFFVLVDGWWLIAGTLLSSYGVGSLS